MKINSILNMGYEVSFDYVKLSSALVPRIKIDHSLAGKADTKSSLISLVFQSHLLDGQEKE